MIEFSKEELNTISNSLSVYRDILDKCELPFSLIEKEEDLVEIILSKIWETERNG